jgi:hypothetical protein
MKHTLSSKRGLALLFLCPLLLPAWAVGCGSADPIEPSAGSGGGDGTSGRGNGGTGGGRSGTGGAGGTGGAAGRQAVTVRGSDGARAGVDVLVHDAPGALVSRTKTDEKGEASVDSPEAGGSITIVHEVVEDDGRITKHLKTYYGLDGSFEVNHFIPGERPGAGGAGGAAGAAGAGGEAAGAGGAAAGAGGAPPALMRVRVTPSAPGSATILSFDVAITCDATQKAVALDGTFALDDYDACGDETYDVLVRGLDANGEPVAYGTVLDAPLQPGGEATHGVVVDQTDLVKRAYTIENAPEGWVSDRFEVEGGRGAARPNLLAHRTDAAGLSGPFWLPAALFARWGIYQSVSSDKGTDGTIPYGAYRKTFAGAPADVTWSLTALARVETIAPDASAEAARPSFSWQLSPQGELGDELTFDAHWNDADGQPAFAWEVEMPPARSATLRLVELPGDLAAYRPLASFVLDNSTVYLRDFVGVGGWSAYHRDGASDEHYDMAAVYYPPSEPAAGAGNVRLRPPAAPHRDGRRSPPPRR